jgi:hypothetical protein
LPDRRELDAWPIVDDAIQLGFPELLVGNRSAVDVARVREALDRHCDGVRSILRMLDCLEGAADTARIHHLASIRERHPSIPIVAFTQFAETAAAAFRGCAQQGGVVLVSGRGARIASGRVTVEEIIRGFDVPTVRSSAPTALPLELLIATDVLSEGLSLRRAGVIVHLDLPWTIARLEQRVGRLRRLGSAHQQIAVYAIGPPVEARELLPLVRALQRKARLSSSMVARHGLHASLPLLGGRLMRAIAQVVRRGEAGAHEELRAVLTEWADGHVQPLSEVSEEAGSFTALGLVALDGKHHLVAANDHGVSESPAQVLHAVRALSGAYPTHASSGGEERWFVAATASIRKWLDEQLGRELARLAADAPSAAHITLLTRLQEILARATRTERPVLAARIERCRQLVLGARGIGAEMAMGRVAGGVLDIQSLERLLASRVKLRRREFRSVRLEALILSDPDHVNRVSAMRLPSFE